MEETLSDFLPDECGNGCKDPIWEMRGNDSNTFYIHCRSCHFSFKALLTWDLTN